MHYESIARYIERMRDFKDYLARRWYFYSLGKKTAPTIRDVAKRFNVPFDTVVMMCEDAEAYDFSVSVSADENIGNRVIELL